MKKLKSLVSVFLALTMLIIPISPVNAAEVNEKDEIFSAMLARAEAAVNYEWVPTQDIAVWNENPYNGKMYFQAAGYKFVKRKMKDFFLSPCIKIQIPRCRSRVKRACFARP